MSGASGLTQVAQGHGQGCIWSEGRAEIREAGWPSGARPAERPSGGQIRPGADGAARTPEPLMTGLRARILATGGVHDA